jgi:HPt (histidine-containing phosphotransfer) domain-containing protein
MQADREKCLKAGMDDYMPKPVRPGKLAETLERWLPSAQESENPASSSVESDRIVLASDEADPQIFDEADLVERLMGDKELAQVIISGFLGDMAKQCESLRVHVEAADHSTTRLLAHTIKGAAANVGAPLLKGAAHEMERAAGAGDFETVRQLLPDLERRYAQLAEMLKRRLDGR